MGLTADRILTVIHANTGTPMRSSEVHKELLKHGWCHNHGVVRSNLNYLARKEKIQKRQDKFRINGVVFGINLEELDEVNQRPTPRRKPTPQQNIVERAEAWEKFDGTYSEFLKKYP